MRLPRGAIVWLLLVVACREQQPAAGRDAGAQIGDDVATCGVNARRVVERFGARLKLVSLLAPDTIVRRTLGHTYGPFVTPELLAQWQADPRRAPGREVSNPWPARIAIRSMHAEGDTCVMAGDVVYVETMDTSSVLELRPVTLHVSPVNGWRISAFESTRRQPTHGAALVIERYYAAIQHGDLRAAYAMWADSGRASGQSFADFSTGYAETERVQVSTGEVRLEGAAGSQYATVPVQIEAELRSGERQLFGGTYTLRRSLVDGATSEQRTWHIHSAEIRPR